MSMTKKDYTAIAEVINSVLWEKYIDPLTVVRLAARLSDQFQQESPRFRNDLFIAECLREREQ